MLAYINPSNLLFIDIETVPEYSSFDQLSNTKKELWALKHNQLKLESLTPEESYLQKAGVYAEFAKIICISIGILYSKPNNEKWIRVKSFSGNDEHQLLHEFTELIKQKFNDPEKYHFCGHNIKEFDIPFISRRLLINKIHLPEAFDNSGKRPWQMHDVDTLQLWKFGDYKNYTSLKLMAEILDIATPKEQIEGKDVCRVYWQENDLSKIIDYCQKDVITVIRLLLRFKGDTDTIPNHNIEIV
jgi:DNA polymerase elongation subunit (family B)